MQKAYVIVSALFFVSLHSMQAQIFIPKAGLTLAKTSRSAHDTQYHYREVNFRPGFMAGIAVESRLDDNFNFQAELLYIQKGQKASERAKGNTVYYHSRNYFLEYIEMPLLLKSTFRKGKKFFYPHVGLSVSYGLGGKVHSLLVAESGGQLFRGTSEGKIRFSKYKDGYPNDFFLGSPFDVGLQAGIGSLLFDKIILEARFSLGLRDFDYYDDEKSHNIALQFSIGVPVKAKKNLSYVDQDSEAGNDQVEDKARPKFYVGFSSGQSATTFEGSEVDFHLEDNPPGQNTYLKDEKALTVAVQLKMEVNNYFFLKSSLSYLKKGAREINGRFTYPLQAEMTYLCTPLLFGFQPFNFGNVRFFNLSVEGGLSANFEIANDTENLTAGLFPGTPVDMKKVLIAQQIGLNAEIKILDGLILFGNYTYFKDMSPFFKRKYGTTYDITNKGKLITGGIMLKLKSQTAHVKQN